MSGIASFISESISDHEKKMDKQDLYDPKYTTERAAYDGGFYAALLMVEDYIANQENDIES